MTRHNFRTLDWVLIENSLGSNGLFLARDGKQRTLMAGQDSFITPTIGTRLPELFFQSQLPNPLLFADWTSDARKAKMIGL